MRLNLIHKIFFLGWCLIFSTLVYSQTDSIPPAFDYPPVDENYLAGTKWQYTHTYNAPTETYVHRADEFYEYFLHLKYDYVWESYLNGIRRKGTWKLNEGQNQLFYNFRNNNWWRIPELTEERLVLEFSVGQNDFQYHFVRVDSDNAPFEKSADELPEIEVEEKEVAENTKRVRKERQQRLMERWRARRKTKKEAKKALKTEKFLEKFEKEPEPILIEIAMVGGGFYGGVDPVLKNFTQIKGSGRLIREYESINNGLTKTKKDISREDLEKLIGFIEQQNFFEYDNFYDCDAVSCHNRKTQDPLPIPLRLSVRYGNKKKVVTISIFGRDERSSRYVDYPKGIDLIVDGINKMAGL